MSSGEIAVGIDVGGTFTDVVLSGPKGELSVSKALSSPDQAVGAAMALEELAPDFSPVSTIIHGTTVATNALLERRGARVALVTSRGFRDVLEFQRQERRNIWDLHVRKTPPLIPRHLRYEVTERMLADGTVREGLSRSDIEAAAREIRASEAEAVVVCFLNSYSNPAHERAAAAALRQALPEAYVVTSSEVAPHFREYERLSTTAISAYVGPRIDAYLSHFADRFGQRGFAGRLLVMGSNGGVLPPDQASRLAVATCLSGPAGGVLATLEVARNKGFRHAISFDMGGTSTDVCLVSGGAALLSSRAEVAGMPISLPMFRIHTVSAGGGSIARIDQGGLLHAGPQSAGSRPGPACYGAGGLQPTVTDALCLMGLLRAGSFFGGRMRLDRAAARSAFEPLAATLGEAPEQVAYRVFAIANAKMAHAVRLVSVREGHDPRDYALVAFGGAGPIHACHVADELGMRRVVVPRHAGAFSAFGLLCADLKRDFVRTLLLPAETLDDASLAAHLAAMAESCREDAAALGDKRALRWLAAAELRYVGQASEIAVPILRPRQPSLARLVAAFHRRHARQFGFANADSPVELVNVRLQAVVPRRSPSYPELAGNICGDGAVDDGAIVLGLSSSCKFLSRDRMAPEMIVGGPAVIEDPTATTFVAPGWTATMDKLGHLDLAKE